MPRVSVIVATCDRPATLAEALASVKAQSFSDWECIVSEDGATDATALAVAATFDPRFRLVTVPHTGFHGRVRNVALRLSAAPLVAFLDDDDLWLPAKLERQVALLEAETDAALVFGPVERFGASRGLWPAHLPARLDMAALLLGNCIPLSSVLARREALEEAGLFPEDVEATPDYELWLRVARRHPLCSHPEALARYRVHPGNISRRKDLEIAELSALYDRIEVEWNLPRRLLSPARRGLYRARARRQTSFLAALPLWLRSLTG